MEGWIKTNAYTLNEKLDFSQTDVGNLEESWSFFAIYFAIDSLAPVRKGIRDQS